MYWKNCDERECKLGWGYNEPLDRLIPIEVNHPNSSLKPIKDEYFFIRNLSYGNNVSSFTVVLF